MILLCLACVALAVVWLVPPPKDRSVLRRLDRRPAERRDGRSGRARPVIGLGFVAVALVGAGLLAGPQGAVVLAAVLVAAGTVIRLAWLQRADRETRLARDDVARACAALAAQVRVGRVPSEALLATSVDCPALVEAADVQRVGGDVVATLRAQARSPGRGGLADLARAWRLSMGTGAPMADVLDRVAATARTDQAVQRTVAAELAGPRATGKVMAVLPVCGLAMGYLLGGDPVQFLLAGPLGWACLLGGTVLAALGALWVDWLSRRGSEL